MPGMRPDWMDTLLEGPAAERARVIIESGARALRTPPHARSTELHQAAQQVCGACFTSFAVCGGAGDVEQLFGFLDPRLDIAAVAAALAGFTRRANSWDRIVMTAGDCVTDPRLREIAWAMALCARRSFARNDVDVMVDLAAVFDIARDRALELLALVVADRDLAPRFEEAFDAAGGLTFMRGLPSEHAELGRSVAYAFQELLDESVFIESASIALPLTKRLARVFLENSFVCELAELEPTLRVEALEQMVAGLLDALTATPVRTEIALA